MISTVDARQTPDETPLVGIALKALLVSAATCLLALYSLLFLPMLWGWQPVILTSNSMAPNVNAGDVVLIDKRKTPSVGDIVTFNSAGTTSRKQLLTHRVIGIEPSGNLITKGDANIHSDSTPVNPADVKGVGKMVVPLVGLPAVLVHSANSLLIALSGVLIAGSLFMRRKPVFRRTLRSSTEPLVAKASSVRTNALGSPQFTALPRTLVAFQYRAIRFLNQSRVKLLDRRLVKRLVVLVATLTLAAITTSAAAFSSTAQSNFDVATKPGYRQTIINDGPVSYWRLGEAPGSTLGVDEMGVASLNYGNTPELGQTGALSASGNSAMRISGTQKAETAANIAALSFTSQVSVEAWIKPSQPTHGVDARFVSKYAAGSVNYILASSGGTRARFIVDLNAAGRQTVEGTSIITDTNRWYHLVGTYDGTAAHIYVDGVLERSVVRTGTMLTTTSPLAIANDYPASNTHRFNGTVDEVSIWNRALTQAEITNHRNSGLGL